MSRKREKRARWSGIAPHEKTLSAQTKVGVAALVFRINGDYLFTTKPKIGDEELWSLPGGRIKHGESPDEAVKRTVFEETGCRAAPIGQSIKALSHVYPDGAHHIVLFYRVPVFAADENLEVERPYKIGWFQSNELPTPQLEPLGEFIAGLRRCSVI